MPHLTLFERIKIVKLFNDLPYGIRAKYERISKQAKDRYSIQISESGVRRLINKWHNTETLADRPRENKSKCLISKGGILAINNAASTRNISRYIKYCQIVSHKNLYFVAFRNFIMNNLMTLLILMNVQWSSDNSLTKIGIRLPQIY